MLRFAIQFIIILFSCRKKEATNPTTALEIQPRKHHIFLVHGIGGDHSHFGSMKPALLKVLPNEDKSTDYNVHYIEYDTKNNQKTIEDFSIDMNEKIIQTVGANPSKNVRISIIMHSQGGLVGCIWLFRAVRSVDHYSSQLIDNLDHFMTFGTPFWGAKTAIFAKNIKDSFSNIGIELPIPFGTKQLEYMEFASDWNYSMRKSILSSATKEDFIDLTKHIFVLNVAATADVLQTFGPFVSGGAQYEDDSAVPLPSSRLNFIYNDHGVVKEIDLAPYRLVQALHLSPLPEDKNLYGIVQTPSKCIENPFCDHPTFELIWKSLLGRYAELKPTKSPMLLSFMIDLNLVVPKELDHKKVEVQLLAQNGMEVQNTNIVFSGTELYAKGSKQSQKYKNMHRFYFHGSFKESSDGDYEELLLRITIPDHPTKDVPITVKRGYSSFIDVQL